ncbi:hypothetical protein ACJX0J_009425 [Zea mays]
MIDIYNAIGSKFVCCLIHSFNILDPNIRRRATLATEWNAYIKIFGDWLIFELGGHDISFSRKIQNIPFVSQPQLDKATIGSYFLHILGGNLGKNFLMDLEGP